MPPADGNDDSRGKRQKEVENEDHLVSGKENENPPG